MAEAAYGHRYRQARAALLASGPACWKCGAPATTADHDPPVSEVGPHLNLRPACGKCNYGDGARLKGQRRWRSRWV